jgi:hypothetical protein
MGGRDVSMLITTVDEPLPSSKDGSSSSSSSSGPGAGAEAAGGAQQLQHVVDPAMPSTAAGSQQPAGDMSGATTAATSTSSSTTTSGSAGAAEVEGPNSSGSLAGAAGVDGSSSSGSSAAGAKEKGYPARREGKMRAHRFILLQCYPREPARLLVSANKGWGWGVLIFANMLVTKAVLLVSVLPVRCFGQLYSLPAGVRCTVLHAVQAHAAGCMWRSPLAQTFKCMHLHLCRRCAPLGKVAWRLCRMAGQLGHLQGQQQAQRSQPEPQGAVCSGGSEVTQAAGTADHLVTCS